MLIVENFVKVCLGMDEDEVWWLFGKFGDIV